MGRFELDQSEKKKPMYISFVDDVYAKIDKKKCKKIAEEAVLKEYNKIKK